MASSDSNFDAWEIRLRHQIERRTREAGGDQLSRPSDRDIAHLLDQLAMIRGQLTAARATAEAWKREAKRGALPDPGPAYGHLSRA
jgi:hypothetical protein